MCINLAIFSGYKGSTTPTKITIHMIDAYIHTYIQDFIILPWTVMVHSPHTSPAYSVKYNIMQPVITYISVVYIYIVYQHFMYELLHVQHMLMDVCTLHHKAVLT